MSQKSITKLALKILLLSIAVTLLLFILTSAVFVFNKDKISSKVLLATNNYTQGDIEFDDISFNPFVQFPKISFTLNSVKYFETSVSIRDSVEMPICDIEYIHAAIDISDLWNGKINISSIIIEKGSVNIITHTDSTTNITNAITSNKLEAKDDTTKNIRKDLLLNHILLKHIDVNYINENKNTTTSIYIDNFQSSLSIKSDSIFTSINSTLFITNISIPELNSIVNKSIAIKSTVAINTKQLSIKVLKGELHFDKVKFGLGGVLNLAVEKSIDMAFEAENSNMHLFGMLLNKQGLNNLQQGNIYIKGTVKGKFDNQIPLIKCGFGIHNVKIDIPNTNHAVSDFNLEGSFTSGIKPDLSQASLTIDSLSSILPNGYINGYIQLNNFVTPEVDYLLDLKTDLSSFHNIFNMGEIDSLSGGFTVFSRSHINTIDALSSNSQENIFAAVTFDSVSFSIPNKIEVNNINGNITGNMDTLCINNLSALVGNSDFHINGNIHNLSNILDTVLSDFTTDLSISSQLFDLTDFLNYRENVGSGFPYQITDLHIDLTAVTDKNRLFTSVPVPDISFNISELNCYVNKLLPPVTIKHINFELGSVDDDLHLEFSDFIAKLDAGELSGSVIYHEPYLKDAYVEVDADIIDFNPAEFFNKNKDPKFIVPNKILNGDAYCKLSFTRDTNVVFSGLEFYSSTLTYSTDSAKYYIEDLGIYSDYVDYNNDIIKNPLATLTSNVTIESSLFKTKQLSIDSISYNVSVDKGNYTFIPHNSWMYFDHVSGYITINPFVKPLSFDANLQVNELDIGKFMAQFIEDTIIKGEVDAVVQLTGRGNDIKDILTTLNGKVNVSGDSLLVYGIDLDVFISKLERTQHFNLVDVGAMLIAGPFGLAITKGADYTRVLLNNKTLTTYLNYFVSDWDVKNGTFIISDVALSSSKSLVAAKGWLNIVNDSLDFTIATIDEKGCSNFSQSLDGKLSEPDMGEMVIIKSLIAPVTNLLKIDAKCNPFYTGKVKYPNLQE